MKPPHRAVFRAALVVSLLEGVAALIFLLAQPSEAGSPGLLGYSYGRLALAGLVVLAVLVLGFSGRRLSSGQGWVEGRLLSGDRLFLCTWGLLAGGVFFLGAFVFTWLFIPPQLRGPLAWLGLLCLQGGLLLRWHYAALWRQNDYRERYRLLPRLKDLDREQRRVLLVLALVGVLYFALFIPFNLQGATSEHDFKLNGGDEYVIYPVLKFMLTPGNTFAQTLYGIFIYEDYHYGYPFYVLSALVLLPVRLIFGDAFFSQYQLNLLLLRQMLNVLPVITAALIGVYLVTRFRSLPKALGLFVLILSIPGVVRYNRQFWHPDGLTVLLVMVTLFFLVRDRQRFGRNFYLAALACGLATSVRVFGVFFFLAVGGYLLAGLLNKKLTLGATCKQGFLFVVLMAAAFFLSSPYLFHASARQRALDIMQEKSTEVDQGYGDLDVFNVYKKGLGGWLPFFEENYLQAWFLAFVGVSLLVNAWQRRPFELLLSAWVIVSGGYLVYFVAVKSFQYMLPVFVPYYAAALSLPISLEETCPVNRPRLKRLAWGITILLCLAQFGLNLAKDVFILS